MEEHQCWAIPNWSPTVIVIVLQDSSGLHTRARASSAARPWGWLLKRCLRSCHPTLGGLIAATLVGALLARVLEVAFAVLTGVVRGGQCETAAMLKPLLAHLVFLVAPVYAPVVALLAFTYLEVSPWTPSSVPRASDCCAALCTASTKSSDGLQMICRSPTRRSSGRTCSSQGHSSRRSTRETATRRVTLPPSLSTRATSLGGWVFPKRHRNSHICAGWCTTSERSGFHRVYWRSPEP